jgi:hypothetical protein
MIKIFTVVIGLASSFAVSSQEPSGVYEIDIKLTHKKDLLSNDNSKKSNSHEVISISMRTVNDDPVSTSSVQSIPYVSSVSEKRSWWHDYVWWNPPVINSLSPINTGITVLALVTKEGNSASLHLVTEYTYLTKMSMMTTEYGQDIGLPDTGEFTTDITTEFNMNSKDSCKVVNANLSFTQTVCVNLVH